MGRLDLPSGSAARWRTPVLDQLIHAGRRARMRRRLDRGGPEFGFDIAGAMGLGETLSHAVLLLGVCDRQALKPRVRFTNPLYRVPGRRDWFGAYFNLRGDAAPADEKANSVKYILVKSQADYALPGVGLDMTLVRANALFHRYLAVDPSLLSEASAFAAAHRLDASSIAVHAPAAGRAELEAQFETLRRLAGAAPHARILLVADSPEQVAFAHRSELAPRLAVYGGGEGADGYRKGAEALVALLLIAGCGVVVRTPSHLAAWSNILNLDQKVVMLTRPPDRFPDARVWRDRWEVSELARWMTQNLRFQSVHDL